MNDTQQNLWIYGAVPAGASLEELERRDGLPEVWIVEAGDLGAIVGTPPPDSPKGTRDQALAHARVLEAAIVDAPVVPFRFGTELPGGDDVVGSDLLEPYGDELSRQLQAVKDVVQMTVKAYYDEDSVLSEIIERHPELRQLQAQTRRGSQTATHGARVEFGELLYKALDLRRTRDSAAITDRLQRVSLAANPGELESEFMVLAVAFLVRRDRIDKFERAVEKLADASGGSMRFVLLGPMPAYNFLDLE